MKNRIAQFTLISLTALGTAAFAQTAQSDPQAAPQTTTVPVHHVATSQQMLNHMTKKLALTGDQQSQILPLLTDREMQVSTITNDSTLSKKERHAKLLAVRSDAQSKIRNVLTDAQRTAYDQMQQEARDKAKTKRLTTVSN